MAQRDAVFLRMLEDPANTDLMAEYARLSVALRDYEAVASTLERLLDQGGGSPALRYELGIAYFALGSYELAEHHFAAVDVAALSEGQRVDLAAYRRRTESRMSGNEVTGSVSVGVALIGSDEVAPVMDHAAGWRYDMGGPDADTWDTEARYRGTFPDAEVEDVASLLRVRTGPSIKLDGTAYGVRLRPYLEGEALSANRSDRFSGALGLEGINPLSARWSVFADVQAGIADQSNRSSPETFGELSLGATYRPTRDTRLRASVRVGAFAETDGSDDGTLTGGRLDLLQRIDPGITASPRDAELTAFVQGDLRDGGADAGDQISVGAAAKLFLAGAAFVVADMTYVTLDTADDAEAAEPIYGLRVGLEF
ncbi:MAG: hypothetical protein AAFQ51_04680 [Pseudomonadota bacterium]